MLNYEQQKKQKIKTLKQMKKFELINRLICYGCIIPFFYATSCLGQKKDVPAIAKIGSAGFAMSAAVAVAIKTKEEKTRQELRKISEEKRKSRQ